MMDCEDDLIENETFDFADGLLTDDEKDMNVVEDEVFVGPVSFKEQCKERWVKDQCLVDTNSFTPEDWCEIFVNAQLAAASTRTKTRSRTTSSSSSASKELSPPLKFRLPLGQSSDLLDLSIENAPTGDSANWSELIHVTPSAGSLNDVIRETQLLCNLSPDDVTLRDPTVHAVTDSTLCHEPLLSLSPASPPKRSTFVLEPEEARSPPRRRTFDQDPGEAASPPRRSTFTLCEAKLLTPVTNSNDDRRSAVSDTSSYYTAKSTVSSPVSEDVSESDSRESSLLDLNTPVNRLPEFCGSPTPPTVKAKRRSFLPTPHRESPPARKVGLGRRSFSCENHRPSGELLQFDEEPIRPAVSSVSVSHSMLRPPSALPAPNILRPVQANKNRFSNPPPSRLMAPSVVNRKYLKS